MLGQLREIGRSWLEDLPCQICGIGFGGPVDFATQRIALSTHAGGWRDFGLPAWVEEELCIPAVMDNDGNVGALGEAVFGAGGCDPRLYVPISTGIGGWIAVGGEVYRGADFYAGEIGHLTVRPYGVSREAAWRE